MQFYFYLTEQSAVSCSVCVICCYVKQMASVVLTDSKFLQVTDAAPLVRACLNGCLGAAKQHVGRSQFDVDALVRFCSCYFVVLYVINFCNYFLAAIADSSML